MNIRVTDPWTTIPTAAFWCGVGGAVSGAVFNKLSHLVEYTLNKRFGDYDRLQKTLDKKIIVSMGDQHGIYYAQNAVLAGLVTAVASLVFRTLLNRGCPAVVAWPFLVGSVAAPILLTVYNLGDLSARSTHRRWVVLSEAEVTRHSIQEHTIGYMEQSEAVYSGFGSEPEWKPGTYTQFY